jgi:hypothetical protein
MTEQGKMGWQQRKLVGPGAGVRKYDVLTWLAMAGLREAGLTATLALRLIALITARYNWAVDEASIGHEELTRLWGVSRRTVIRDIDKLRTAGLLVQTRPARRGRVGAYRLGHDRIIALAEPLREGMGADLCARTAPNAEKPVDDGRVVVVFPRPDDVSLHDRLRNALVGAASEAALARWFDPLRCEIGDGGLTLCAPSAFHADYVERTFGDRLRRAAATLGETRMSVRAG